MNVRTPWSTDTVLYKTFCAGKVHLFIRKTERGSATTALLWPHVEAGPISYSLKENYDIKKEEEHNCCNFIPHG
jgi:hypothetical protein